MDLNLTILVRSINNRMRNLPILNTLLESLLQLFLY